MKTTTSLAPNCDTVKTYLRAHNIPYEEKDLEDPDVMVNIMYGMGEMPMEAPVLQVGNTYYTPGGKITELDRIFSR